MSNDKIIAAWNRMNPDSNTKIKILQQIQAKQTISQEISGV